MTELSPKTNTELFGHEAAEAGLARDLAAGKLAHGILIGGPEGIGKATLAYRLARLLLPGGERRIAAGSHTDLLVVEKLWDAKKEQFANEISVEQARGIAQFLSLTPGEGQWRVVIIDPVDALNTAGSNAILKILEEPPPQAVLLLISHNPGRLLPTIRSRCRLLKLAPLSPEDFRRAMRLVAPQADADALGPLSGNAPGLAARLEGQGALAMYGDMLALLADAPALDAAKIHAFAERFGSGAHEEWKLLKRLALFLFERAAMPGAKPILREEGPVLERLAALHPPHEWAKKWQRALEQFSLAQARHLDYKQLAIVFFHEIMEKEVLAASG